MSSGKIEVLVGVIASGKSGYAKERAEEGAIIINDDSIVTALHGGLYKLYSKDLKQLYKTVELSILTSGLMMGRQVVVDRGLDVTIKGRQRWIAIGRTFDVPVCATVFPIDSCFSPPTGLALSVAVGEHAIRRYNSDARGLPFREWTEAAHRQITQFQYPTEEEGFIHIQEYKKCR